MTGLMNYYATDLNIYNILIRDRPGDATALNLYNRIQRARSGGANGLYPLQGAYAQSYQSGIESSVTELTAPLARFEGRNNMSRMSRPIIAARFATNTSVSFTSIETIVQPDTVSIYNLRDKPTPPIAEVSQSPYYKQVNEKFKEVKDNIVEYTKNNPDYKPGKLPIPTTGMSKFTDVDLEQFTVHLRAQQKIGAIENIDKYICPITRAPMKEPVTLNTGRTFEKDAIEQWQETSGSNTDPLDRTIFDPTLTIDDFIATELISEQVSLFRHKQSFAKCRDELLTTAERVMSRRISNDGRSTA